MITSRLFRFDGYGFRFRLFGFRQGNAQNAVAERSVDLFLVDLRGDIDGFLKIALAAFPSDRGHILYACRLLLLSGDGKHPVGKGDGDLLLRVVAFDLVVDIEALEKIAAALTEAPIELLITDNDTIQALNATYRKKDKPTDVLSFPVEQEIPGMPLGSIVISEAFVRERAAEFGHTQQDELALLFIHGLLHLLGYDHEVDNGEMRTKEEQLIKQFELPESLIVRTI